MDLAHKFHLQFDGSMQNSDESRGEISSLKIENNLKNDIFHQIFMCMSKKKNQSLEKRKKNQKNFIFRKCQLSSCTRKENLFMLGHRIISVGYLVIYVKIYFMVEVSTYLRL